MILGSESFKNAKLLGDAISGSSATYNDTGSATVINANSNRYFHWQTVNEHVSAGVTLCLSVMYKPVSGTDELCMEINYNNTWAVIKAADQIEIKQTNGWVLRYGLWTPSSDAIVNGWISAAALPTQEWATTPTSLNCFTPCCNTATRRPRGQLAAGTT